MKKLIIIACFCTLLFCSSCSLNEPYKSQEYAMDTFLTQTLYGEQAETAAELVADTARMLENEMSSRLVSSDLYKLNDAGSGVLEGDARTVFDLANYYTEETKSAFCYSLGNLIDLWGIGTDHEGIPDQKDIDNAIVDPSLIETGDTIKLNGTKLDFGAILKGYALDSFYQICLDNDVVSGLIDFGGSICAIGCNQDGEAWTVGITDPDSNEIVATAQLESAFISTSGNYQRYFEVDGKRYHHILDIRTGYPADNGLTSVSVISDSGVETDVYSTALFVMGKEKGRDFADQNDICAVFIEENGNITLSDTAERYSIEIK